MKKKRLLAKDVTQEQLKDELKKISNRFKKELKKSPDQITTRFYNKNSKYGDRWRFHYNIWDEFKKDVFGSPVENKKLTRASFNNNTKDDRNKSHQRKYFVTAAVAGQSVNQKFFNSIKNYCKLTGAEFVLMPMLGTRKQDTEYAKELIDNTDHFVTEYVFNSNLKALEAMLSPQQINPLTGFKRLGFKNSSFIVASPKQQLEVVPVSSVGFPHLLHSTGCITNPDSYAFNRQGMLARQDHIVGGLIIEIEDQQLFHIREVQADKKGGFYDLNKYYLEDTVTESKAKAFVMGDYHAGFHDSSAVEAWTEVVKLTKPDYILFHDLFDGVSISHHSEHDLFEQVNRPANVDTLEKELLLTETELNKWSSTFPDSEMVIVRSNHDEHLDRYLREARYVKDRFNHKLSLKLALHMLDGLNPIEQHVKTNKNVRWLQRDEDFKVAGIQLGYHGDKSGNGARGSANTLELSFGKSVVGHMHTPQILRDTWVVGTTSILHRSYTKGHPSSWLHTSCLIYETGQRTLITSVDGKWKI